MKFSERFSIAIYRLSASGFIFSRRKKKLLREMIDDGSFRRLIRRGVNMLNQESREEIRNWVISKQAAEGGFPDRGGKCDLYYTLFGFFLAEVLDADPVFPALREYIRKNAREQNIHGIDLFCMAILNASLFPGDKENERLAQSVGNIISDNEILQNGYSPFLMILSLLALRDFRGIGRLLKTLRMERPGTDKPCTVVAAQQVVVYLGSGVNKEKARTARDTAASTGPFWPFYRESGGFTALKGTPEPDLLSTAAALFTLRSMDFDLRLIRPDCLGFVTSLYHNGGFRAVSFDEETDVEYTFYGLLALGALNADDGQK